MQANTANKAGLELAGQNRYEEALRQYERAISLDAGCAEAHFNRGVALLALHREGDAVGAFEAVLSIWPDAAEAHNNLAAALIVLGRYELAAAHCERAVSINPRLAEAHNTLGRTQEAQGRTLEAVASYERAVQLRPDFADAHNNLGNVLRELGRLNEAIGNFERAIELSPRVAAYYRSLATSRRFTSNDRYLTAMRSLAKGVSGLPRKQQIELHFALGKVLADIEDYDASFRHLLLGNALKRQEIDYDETRRLAVLDRIGKAFSTELMEAKRGTGDPSPVPIFILGMPRSGTTLVEQILASHPAVHGAGELAAFRNVIDGIKAPHGVPGGFPEIVEHLPLAEFRSIGERYLRQILPLAPGASRITDKMPANFQLVGLIHLALPNARIIHTCRDPLDTCLSCFSWLFEVGQPFTYDLGELGRYYRAYSELIAHWHDVLPAGVMIDVRYEDVVADLEGQTRRILAHCGLEWDPACVAFHTTERSVRTASAAQVRQPIYRTSIGRWRAYGDRLDPLLRYLPK